MKNKLSIFLFILFTGQLLAQVERNSTLTDLGLSISEKTTLWTDRDSYFSGGEIYFNVYNFIEENPSNENLSKVIYLELFNHQLSFLKEKLVLRNGMASGILDIPNELETGNYFIRAYTQYQRNQNPEALFTKVLKIVNPTLPPSPFQFIKDEHIKFSTENGNLEIGQLNTVTYFIHPVLIENATQICLINEENRCLNLLKVSENGLGKFSFIPQKDKEYFIQLKLKNEQFVEQKIEINNRQLLVKTYRSSEVLRLNIGILDPNTYNISDSLKLVVKSPYFKKIGESKFKLNAGVASIRINPKILETGINYAVIQNIEGRILHVHPIFQKAQNSVRASIKLNKKAYTARELIGTQILLPKGLKYANISMAVVKRGSKNSHEHLPYFLIENPVLLNFWATTNDPNDNLCTEINLLMKLHENEINSSLKLNTFKEQEKSKIFWLPETRGVSISGILRHNITKVPQQNSKLILSVLGDHPQTHFTNTKVDGSFVFALRNLNGRQSLSINIDDFNTSNFELLINNDFAILPTLKNSAIWFSKAEKEHINEMFFNRQAELAFNLNSTKTIVNPSPYKNLWIYDTTIYMKDYVASENMEQLIDEVVPFVHARETDGKFAIEIQDKEILSTYTSPLVLLDNYPVKNINELLKLNPKTILKVSVIYSPYHSGNRKLNGVVSFQTHTDNFGGLPTNQSTVFFDFITESIPRKKVFRSDKSENIAETSPDFHILLYWNPSIKISDDTEIKFYSSDDESLYDILVQGISKDGKAFTGKTSFKVKNR